MQSSKRLIIVCVAHTLQLVMNKFLQAEKGGSWTGSRHF